LYGSIRIAALRERWFRAQYQRERSPQGEFALHRLSPLSCSLYRRTHSHARAFVLPRDREWNGAPEPRRKIEGLGQHQAVVCLGCGRVLRSHAHREAVQPLFGFLAHRTAKLSERHITWRIAAEEVDTARFIRRVALTLRSRRSEHHVPVGVVDGEDPLGADDADFQAVHRARPDGRQGPGYRGVVEAPV